MLKFNGHLNIYFSDIDTAWLKRYESWLRGQEFSENTIGRRFRTLRLYIMSLLRERLPSRNTTLSSLIKCRNCTERPLNVLSAKRKYFGSSTMPAIVLMSDWPSICSLSAIIWGESIS
ncbi:MAG: phage integrase SAM-like domain-containing protein [Alistipes ihumii]